jgi:hypothetical protein
MPALVRCGHRIVVVRSDLRLVRRPHPPISQLRSAAKRYARAIHCSTSNRSACTSQQLVNTALSDEKEDLRRTAGPQ